MEKKIELSVDTVKDWLTKFAQTDSAPAWIGGALMLLNTLKNKKLELVIRTVDE